MPKAMNFATLGHLNSRYDWSKRPCQKLRRMGSEISSAYGAAGREGYERSEKKMVRPPGYDKKCNQ